ncbi:uncharacterized protein PRCAT00001161001 [Priceomyces carsonii]|uniref:uncharacterized protein n=1 Tax=Priceomyces carsonii TaxID=28549 RepID=UPI002EDA2D8F|nr:unnamed protein product [Priceomyces carsonii]
MTTNHRPTLESKKGKNILITDTIVHSRSLPQQTQLKYRNDYKKIDTKLSRAAVLELNKELSQGRSDSTNSTKDVNENLVIPDDEDEKGADGESQLYGSEDNENDSEYSSEDSEDSEYETVALMAELEKVKEEKRLKKNQEEQRVKVENAKVSNPLVPLSKTKLPDDFKVKKDWRNSTAFKKTNSPKKGDDDSYTNDTLNSDFHQKFLSKYVR